MEAMIQNQVARRGLDGQKDVPGFQSSSSLVNQSGAVHQVNAFQPLGLSETLFSSSNRSEPNKYSYLNSSSSSLSPTGQIIVKTNSESQQLDEEFLLPLTGGRGNLTGQVLQEEFAQQQQHQGNFSMTSTTATSSMTTLYNNLLHSHQQDNSIILPSAGPASGGGGLISNSPTEQQLSSSELLLVVLLISIIIISIVGNCLVCIAIFTDRRLRKLGNAFIVSLAIADLFVSCLVMTFALCNDLMNYWMFGDWFCDIWISFDVMCCTASILNLCAISLDRFIHIKDCLLYNQWMTRKVALSAVVLIWIISGLVSFVPITLGWHKPPIESILMANNNYLASASASKLLRHQRHSPVLSEPLEWALTSNPEAAADDDLHYYHFRTQDKLHPYDRQQLLNEKKKEATYGVERGSGQDHKDKRTASLMSGLAGRPLERVTQQEVGTEPRGSREDDNFFAPSAGERAEAGEGGSSFPLPASVQGANLSKPKEDDNSIRQPQQQQQQQQQQLYPTIKQMSAGRNNIGPLEAERNSSSLGGAKLDYSYANVAVERKRPRQLDESAARSGGGGGGEGDNNKGGNRSANMNHSIGPERAQQQQHQLKRSGGLVAPAEAFIHEKRPPDFVSSGRPASGGGLPESAFARPPPLSDGTKRLTRRQTQTPSPALEEAEIGTTSSGLDGEQQFSNANTKHQQQQQQQQQQHQNQHQHQQTDELPQCQLTLTPTYAVVSSTISFYIPCIIMLGLYSKLFACARRHVRNIRAISRVVSPLQVPPVQPAAAACPLANTSFRSADHPPQAPAPAAAAAAGGASRPETVHASEAGERKQLMQKCSNSIDGRNTTSSTMNDAEATTTAQMQTIHDTSATQTGVSVTFASSLAQSSPQVEKVDQIEPAPRVAASRRLADGFGMSPARTWIKFGRSRKAVPRQQQQQQQQQQKDSATSRQAEVERQPFLMAVAPDTAAGPEARVGPESQKSSLAAGNSVQASGATNDEREKKQSALGPTKSYQGGGGGSSNSSIRLNLVAAVGGGRGGERSSWRLAKKSRSTSAQNVSQRPPENGNNNNNKQQTPAPAVGNLSVQQQQQQQQQQQANSKQTTSQLATHKAAITLGIIMGTFLFCWVPFFCLNIIKAFCVDCIPNSMFRAFTWLGYANSALNPIIYGIHNSEFRNAFNRIFFKHLTLKNGRQYLSRRFSYDLRNHHHHHHHHHNRHNHQQQQPPMRPNHYVHRGDHEQLSLCEP